MGQKQEWADQYAGIGGIAQEFWIRTAISGDTIDNHVQQTLIVVQTELKEIMEEVDDTNSGGIDFAQFLIFMTRQSEAHEDVDELREAFAVMDTDNDGHISSEDLEKVLRKLGCNFAKDEIDEMIKVADTKGEGSVNIEEFLSVMRS